MALLGGEYTTEELSELIRSMGDADIFRLEAAGRVLALKCRREPGDLLNEAIMRSLDGRRRCPKAMKVTAFLFGAMRSIANEWVERGARERGTHDETQWGTSDDVEVEDLADNAPGQLDVLEANELRAFGRNVLKEVKEMFESDDQAWFVIEADMDGGLSPDDICATLGIDRQRYNAVRKRVRRGLEQIRRRYPGDRP